MAKKPITPITPAPLVESKAETRAGKPAKKTTAKAAAAKKPTTPKAKTTPKTATPRTRVKAAPVTKGSPVAGISSADIALRAYYIAEKRQKLGLPGDSTSDWVEAERQLKAEAKAKR